MEYLVTWTIQLEATSPLDAAQQARSFQLDETASVGVFHVTEENEEKPTIVDLDNYLGEQFDAYI